MEWEKLTGHWVITQPVWRIRSKESSRNLTRSKRSRDVCQTEVSLLRVACLSVTEDVTSTSANFTAAEEKAEVRKVSDRHYGQRQGQ